MYTYTYIYIYIYIYIYVLRQDGEEVGEWLVLDVDGRQGRSVRAAEPRRPLKSRLQPSGHGDDVPDAPGSQVLSALGGGGAAYPEPRDELAGVLI